VTNNATIFVTFVLSSAYIRVLCVAVTIYTIGVVNDNNIADVNNEIYDTDLYSLSTNNIIGA
jgi:hypothetical protein